MKIRGFFGFYGGCLGAAWLSSVFVLGPLGELFSLRIKECTAPRRDATFCKNSARRLGETLCFVVPQDKLKRSTDSFQRTTGAIILAVGRLP